MLMLQRSEYAIAFQKAEEVNRLVQSNRFTANPFIQLEEITAAVKQLSGFDSIKVLPSSFSKMPELREKYGLGAKKIGGMLTTFCKGGKSIAKIYVNVDADARSQRFSIAHELGHLITQTPKHPYLSNQDGVYTVSTHICPDITAVSAQGDPYLIAEQTANIFAILVLIPRNLRIRDLVEADVPAMALRYGVSQEAIYSRMLLTNISLEEAI